MPEAPRIPFLRVTRPYGSEKEFIDGDFGWVGRTTLVLPGTQARATGELVRFEVVLTTGSPVLRGEGNVVAHHPPSGSRPAGLEVRFTRVDARSKLMLDRVRERRAIHAKQGPASLSPPDAGSVPSLAPQSPPVLKAPADTPSERSGVHLSPKAASRIAPPANRDEILDRLRARAKELASAGGLAYKKR